MRKVFETHRRYLPLGLVGALILALSVVGGLALSSGSAHAQSPTPTPTPVPLVATLVHVNPDGSDYTGNPLCPQTVWSADGKAKVVAVDPRHDCNNITSQRHVIRTDGLAVVGIAPDGLAAANFLIGSGFNIEGVGTIEAAGRCNTLGDVVSRPLWAEGVDDDDDCVGTPPVPPATACGTSGGIDEDPVDGIDNDDDTLIDEDPPSIRDGEMCVVIHSKDPGETRITHTYFDGYATQTTDAVFKEWDKMIDTVILKAADIEAVTSWGKMVKDADGDGNRDAADEHLLNHDGETQEHAVIFDEALKGSKSADGPIQLIEAVHGRHVDFPDHGTEGAVVMAFIDDPRQCTYFTNPADPGSFLGTAIVGRSDWRGWMVGPRIWPTGAQFTAEALAEAAAHGLAPGMSNNGDEIDVDLSFEASMLGVYVDTLCETQAVITFKVGYPDFVQSVPEIPAPESVTINWFTVELAKQPQIRWAGEEIVLEKRWALPGDWFPELGAGVDNDGDTLINEDPCDDDKDGLCNEEYPPDGKDTDKDGNEDGTRANVGDGNCANGIDDDADTKIDEADASCTAFVDEDTGVSTKEDNDADCVGTVPDSETVVPTGDGDCGTSGGIDEDGPDSCPLAGELVKYSKLGGPGGLISGLPDVAPITASEPDVVWTIIDESCVSRALYSSEDPGEVDVEATLGMGFPFNKHAFLVWYIKIYQVKLDNVPLTDNVGRELHNAGVWSGADPLDLTNGVTEETLNVSQDALARVTVKGWMRTADQSGRGAVCIDMDGDGDGVDDDADTLLNEDPKDGVDNDGDTETDEDTQVAGQPYPLAQYEAGCPDSNDAILDHGYWVLPDDMEALAGPDPDRVASWDVMSEPDVAADALIGYKSTLDSHDDILHKYVKCVVIKKTGVPDFDCTRKTIDPDGKITDADAIMPPLKILAQILDNEDGVLDVGESGFLKMANKVADVGIKSAYSKAEIAASSFIPTPVNNGGYDWDSWGFSLPNGKAQGPYVFFDVLTKHEEMDALQRAYIRNFRFYTDNRGLGYFFVNGDFKLTFDDCLRQQLSGTPDCFPGDVVGLTDITVIGDYPYFRKHPAVESNLIEKTWTWDGFKSVTAEKLDATHTKVIAHLRDRDGYCKWEVGADPTKANSVTFSPSINEVQHEWIEFLLNTDVGFIRDISPNSLYLGTGVSDQHSQIDFGLPRREILKINDHVHVPLAKVRSNALEEGFIFEAERAALARAEDVRVLSYYDKDAAVDPKYTDPSAPDECQAWVLIEHPADLTPNVSVVFHDPEGQIDRHYPTSQFVSILNQGWNDSCYTGPALDIEGALTDAGLIEADGTSHVLAVYRFTNDDAQAFDHWFPGRPDIEDTITTIAPYDQLFLLLDSPMSWTMDVVADTTGQKDTQVSLIENWSSVCYAGADKAPEEAAASINNSLVIMYTLASDQTWRRYVPNRAELTNIITLNQYTSVFTLMTNAGIWVFDP